MPSRITTLLLLLSLFPSLLFAQGKLKGTVTDAQTSDALIGANIILEGTSIGAAADIEGDYYMTAIPSGEYTIKCSFIGYRPKETKVTIVEGRTVELNFELTLDIVEGEEVLITAQALGQAAAINQQISSNTSVNVVSEQKIQELPDANAAEALGRLPGVAIQRSGGEAGNITLRGLGTGAATVTVDGVKLSPTEANGRGIDLSTIAQGSLAGIELHKAITSDKDAEAVGGNINFVTKGAPEERVLRLDSYGSYNNLEDDYKQYNFVLRYGERFFDNLFGVQAFSNLEKRNRSSESYSAGYRYLDSDKDYEINSFNVGYTQEIRERKGGKLLLDYRTPDDGVIKLSMDFNSTDREIADINRNYPVGTPEIGYGITVQDIQTNIFNSSLLGENHIYDWQVNWGLSFVESYSKTPFYNNMSFLEPSSVVDGEVFSGMETIPVEYRKGPFEALIPYSKNNFNLAYLDRSMARTNRNIDNEITLKLDLKKEYNFMDMSGEFKIGGKYRSKFHKRHSTFAAARYYDGSDFTDFYKNDAGEIIPKDYEKYGFENLLLTGANQILFPNFIKSNPETRDIFDQYSLNPIILSERVRAWHEMSRNGYLPTKNETEYEPDRSEDGKRYSLTETVTAAYLMNTLNITPKLTLITGVRMEHDNNDYNAFYTPREITQFSQFKDTSSTHQETNFMPNFHLIYKPVDFMTIRLAAYKGLTRPGFDNRLPVYLVGTRIGDSDGIPFLFVRDTKLKNTTSWSYEVNTQFYSNTIGLISISAYYKEFKNPIQWMSNLKVQGREVVDSLGIALYNDEVPFTTSYNLSYPFNSEYNSRVWGFEFEHQANFRFLPGLLKNIVLDYNISIVKGEAYTPSRDIITTVDTVYLPFPIPIETVKEVPTERKTTIANSPEIFGNIALGYDIGGFSARLSYFYQDQYYGAISRNNRSNSIKISFSRLDLSLKQSVTDYLAIGLNINNLTDTKEGSDQENGVANWVLTAGRLRYGTTADLWLRVSL